MKTNTNRKHASKSRVTFLSKLASVAIFAALLAPAAMPSHRTGIRKSSPNPAPVTMFHNDLSRTGQYPTETTLTQANVNSNTFGRLFTQYTGAASESQPLYYPQVNISGKGVHDTVFLATTTDKVYAFDAHNASGSNSTPLWSVAIGTPMPQSAFVSGNEPYVGILSTPVIDGTTNTIYVCGMVNVNGTGVYQLHRRPRGAPGLARHNQDALHRAGVVLCISAWEAYVEALVRDALNAIRPADGAPPYAVICHKLVEIQVERDLGKFNTPNGENVRRLYQDSVGFDPHGSWSWRAPRRNWGASDTKNRLNEWLRIRHSIAHGFALPSITWLLLNGTPRLTLTHLRDCKGVFEHLVGKMDPDLSTFMTTAPGKGDRFQRNAHGIAAPW